MSKSKQLAEMTREHRILFLALAEIRAELDNVPVLGVGDDYLSQLLKFRRNADFAISRAWEQLGLS